MRLSELLKHIEPRRIRGDAGAEITTLHYDSRQVLSGGMFFALRGAAVDGHAFIDEAVRRGAAAVVMEEDRSLPESVAAIRVDDARRTMAALAAAFFGDPTQSLPTIGVTGTNGKTTVTYLLESVLRAAGKNPAVFGTINYRLGGRRMPAPHTTPESVDLLRTVGEFRRDGADALVLEVSSHALDQHRVAGVRFDAGVFTNLTAEHLDYHGDLEEYFASKCRLFSEDLLGDSGWGAVNIDDPYGGRLAAGLPRVLTCGSREGAQVRVGAAKLSLKGIAARVETPRGGFDLESPLLGQFNLQNLLCATAGALALGLPLSAVAEGLADAPQVPGRLERIENDRGALIVVDYAHTGDALEKVLGALGDLGARRMITVFGCGGDRDRGKRPVMGEVAGRCSDLAVLTTDNPRGEDPQVILEEIRQGLLKVFPRELSSEQGAAGGERGFVTVPDRAEAIAYAVGLLGPGDLLLVAGKGHETYQQVGRERFHFDDREVVRQALAGAGGTVCT